MKQYAIFVLSIILCFVALEVFVRIVWQEPGFAYPKNLLVPDKELGYVYATNFSGHFSNKEYKNVSFVTNSKGMRDIDHAYTKGNKTRILF